MLFNLPMPKYDEKWAAQNAVNSEGANELGKAIAADVWSKLKTLFKRKVQTKVVGGRYDVRTGRVIGGRIEEVPIVPATMKDYAELLFIGFFGLLILSPSVIVVGLFLDIFIDVSKIPLYISRFIAWMV